MPSGKSMRGKPQQLTFDSMVSNLRATMAGFPDKRTGKNSRYSIEDAALGAFSVFFTQSPSFLSFQETMLKIEVKAMLKPCLKWIKFLVTIISGT